MQKILSVSVAAYNLGNMIEECLNSFVNSTAIDKAEIIVTDDGSSDDTAERAQKFADAYPDSVKLVRQKNAGPGSTVNSGILHATGKYFRMVDGDDWVNTDNFTDFINFLEICDSDAVVSDYDIFDDSAKSVAETKRSDLISGKTVSVDDCAGKFRLEMHALTFRTEILKNNGVVLDNGFYTDVEYVLLALQYVKTVSYFNKSVYVYRVARAGQSMSAASIIKNNAQHVKVLDRLCTVFKENKRNYSAGIKKCFAKRVGAVCDMQLKALIISGDKKTQKPEIRAFVSNLKKNHPEIYSCFKKGKKYKLLVFSGYLFYGFIKKKILKNAVV
ncbi:MAG: glycosyltransferase family 2 protein [Clostridia bacterium]|nr:glycosyltransferase family 2 protein [Clostridia bacterium]